MSAIDGFARRIATPIGFCAAFALFAAAHAGLRFAFSDAIAVDEVVETVFAQSWALGYDPKQPPLYTWLLRSAQLALGPTAETFHLLKYALLGVGLLALRGAALRMTGDPVFAGAAAFAILLTYQVGWNAHDGVTHTLTLFAACGLTLWLFVRIIDDVAWWMFPAIGAALGFGLLSKYGFFAGPFALAVGAAATARGRAALRDPRWAIALVVAAGIAAPYYALWLWDQAAAAYVIDGGGERMTTVARIGGGLISAVAAPLLFLTPLLPALLVAAPRRMLRPAAPADDWERMLAVAAIASFGVLALGVLFGGVVAYAERWMHPFFFFAPLWLALRWRRAAPPRPRLKGVLAFAAVFFVASLAARAAPYLVGPPACGQCRYSYPYAETLVPRLEAVGAARGGIVAFDEHIAGNLRQAFPEASVFTPHVGFYRPPRAEAPCIAVWDRRRAGDRPDLAAAAGVSGFGREVRIDGPTRMPFAVRDTPTVAWAYAVSTDACRGATPGS